MSQTLHPGDFLVFQLEAGYGLLRVLDFEDDGRGRVWHLAAYSDLFLNVDSAETAAMNPTSLGIALGHVALTDRAFESTQVAKIANLELTAGELAPLERWREDPNHAVSDRSIRLMIGLR